MGTDNNIAVIILAGGHSSRMGYPKPWLKNDDNVTFLSEIITSYKQFGINEVIVVLNEKFTTREWENELLISSENATIIKNNLVDKGRLHSLQLGLNHSSSDFNIIHNVDNPFVEYKVLAKLLTDIENQEIIIPTYNNKGGHPVIISKNVKNEITNNYNEYSTLKDVFFKFKKKYVDVNSNTILININTPKDLESLFYEPVL
ncbi:MAG: NTP transferase domain-containing protein [Flavobacteriales bacterium]|jgi:molybdenum cofactor cytidylyltransferase|nr:NTP transferase domain-containing protein [Flavobacteriales bacterium]